MRLIEYAPKRWAEFLKGRKPILESIVPLTARGKRDWKAMGDDSLLAYARFTVMDMGMRSRRELKDRDSCLHAAIHKRGLADSVGLENKNAGDRNWAQMSSDEIIGYARRIIDEQGMGKRKHLESFDRGLYKALSTRGLLGVLPFDPVRELRDWASLRDEELITIARDKIKSEGITNRNGLRISDKGFYEALRRRDLLGRIGLQSTKEGARIWTEFDNDRLLMFTQEFIIERGIRKRDQLKKTEGGYALYKALQRRGLLNDIEFPDERSHWRMMEDNQLVEYARRIFSSEGTGSRGGVSKVNISLYSALARRGLIEEVFSEVESLKKKEAIDSVIGALDSFGDDE